MAAPSSPSPSSAPPPDFVVPCQSESFHLYHHSLGPKTRQQFHCYELLLLQHLDADPTLYDDLCDTFGECDECNGSDAVSVGSATTARASRRKDFLSKHWSKIVADDLWFLHVALQQARDKLVLFVRKEMERNRRKREKEGGQGGAHAWTKLIKEADAFELDRNQLLTRYLRCYNFVELHLDNVFSNGTATNAQLPSALFKFCPNATVLSLRSNYIRKIPPDIGRLKKLRKLCLTNNSLQNGSIPFSLTFCDQLSELYLDNNLLDALPGFLLGMRSLATVHRHGNHNYFKATFMWYHTDVNERILEAPGVEECENEGGRSEGMMAFPSLQQIAMKTIVASRENFFESNALPPAFKDRIANATQNLNLCDNCPAIRPVAAAGFKVYTFKNPYLGNTCVPFLHWACSLTCAREIEVPARIEQLESAEEQDRIYREYVSVALQRHNSRSKLGSKGGAGGGSGSGTPISLSCASQSAPASISLLSRRSLNASRESIDFTKSSEGGGNRSPSSVHNQHQQHPNACGIL